MGTQDEFNQAVALAKQGKLEDARNILITLDHPNADKLLVRINSAIASSATSAPKALASDTQPSLIVRIISAVIIFNLSSALAGFGANVVYNFENIGNVYNNNPSILVYGVFFVLWALLMFISFTLSRRLLTGQQL